MTSYEGAVTRYHTFDEAVVDEMIRGATVGSGRPGFGERLEVVRRMAAAGYSDSQIAARIRRSTRTVLRIRERWQIRGLPLGLNGSTRPVEPMPMPVRGRTERGRFHAE